MFEALVAAFDAICGILEAALWIFDLLTLIGNLHALFKGRDNRIERATARAAGLPPPPRDRWNHRVIWLTVLFILLSLGLLLWRLARRSPAVAPL